MGVEDLEVQSFEGQKFKSSKVQRFKGSEVQWFRGSMDQKGFRLQAWTLEAVYGGFMDSVY